MPYRTFLSLLTAVLLFQGCYSAAGRLLDLPPYTHAMGKKQTLMLPMRDGTKLYTEVYLPAGEGPWPVIVIRNPYNFPGGFGPFAKLFSNYGFVGIHQIARGRAVSEGEWLPFFNERNDGLDTLDWVIAQPWHNGNIGLYGASYLSMVQWAIADQLPPEVKTMVPMVWGSDVRGVAYQRGMFRPEVATAWAALMHNEKLDIFNAGNFHKAIAHRPHAEADELFFGRKLPWYQEWLVSGSGDAPLWQLPDAKLLGEIPRHTKVPVLMISGWYDIFIPSQMTDFERLASRSQSRMIVGPWTHLSGFAGDGIVPIPNAGSTGERLARVLNWFDHHLKGAPLDEWGPVATYAIRDDHWRDWSSWPPPTQASRLHMQKFDQEHPCYDGELVKDAPEKASTIEYVYDPADPVPSRGGAGLLTFALVVWGGTPPSMRDQKGLCERPDVISFLSPRLAKDAHIAGRIQVAFTVSSDADDTSFTAKLIDVAPDGTAVNIRDSITALAYADGATIPTPYTPGDKKHLVLEMWPIEWKIPAGHRIRVDISSSNYPAYNIHSNYAGPWAQQANIRPARQTLHFGADDAAYVELPLWAGETAGRR